MPRVDRLACPRCGKAMEQGFILEKGDSNSATVSAWVEGAPEIRRWTGLKLKNRRVIRMQTFRCKGCGYLESYAPDDTIV